MLIFWSVLRGCFEGSVEHSGCLKNDFGRDKSGEATRLRKTWHHSTCSWYVATTHWNQDIHGCTCLQYAAKEGRARGRAHVGTLCLIENADELKDKDSLTTAYAKLEINKTRDHPHTKFIQNPNSKPFFVGHPDHPLFTSFESLKVSCWHFRFVSQDIWKFVVHS